MVSVSNGAFVDDIFCATRTAGEMQTLVCKEEAFSVWTGIDIHVKNSEITAYDFGRNCPLETDPIRLLGSAFTKLPPDQPFKFLGVRLTLTGDWTFEKQHVWCSMVDHL